MAHSLAALSVSQNALDLLALLFVHIDMLISVNYARIGAIGGRNTEFRLLFGRLDISECQERVRVVEPRLIVAVDYIMRLPQYPVDIVTQTQRWAAFRVESCLHQILVIVYVALVSAFVRVAV